jgi:Fe-S cluster assembly protein SufD
MNAAINPVPHYQAEFQRLRHHLPGSWLADARAAAIERFAAQGLPTTRLENWKYTDVRPIAHRAFVTAVSVPETPPADRVAALRFPGLDCHELVFINGRYAHALSTLRPLPDGARIGNLAITLNEPPAGALRHLNRCADSTGSGFTHLNTAFMADGACVEVPDDAAPGAPVLLLYLSVRQAEPAVSHPRNLIVLGKNARATVIESYIGLEDAAENFTNAVTEIILHAGAALEHYRVQQEGSQSYHVSSIHVQQEAGSRYESHVIALGGALSRTDLETRLAAAGAETVLNGLYMAGGRQHVDHHTRIDHLAPHTRSAEYYRGVLAGRARAVFNGKVVVHQDAQKTDAHQSNANLLLSADAEVDTKPELEIYADDVKCSHGATVGQLDEDALFYLRARAIDLDTARSLLTYAFAEDIITRMRFQPIRNRLSRLVLGRLPEQELIREFV